MKVSPYYSWVVGAPAKWGNRDAKWGNIPIWHVSLQMALNLPTLPLQARRRPSPAVCSSVFEQLSGLVSRSTVMEPVGQ